MYVFAERLVREGHNGTSNVTETLAEDFRLCSALAEGPLDTWTLVLVVLLVLCTATTAIGNILVMVAFAIEERLRTNFNHFLVNLAVTDLVVSLTAMPLFTIDFAYGRWPFGAVLCGLWIFMDWGMTFASIFTLVAISADRYWATRWSTHYRRHNNRRRTLIIILLIWLTTLAFWVPSFAMDRVRMYGDVHYDQHECIWAVQDNRIFSVIVALFGYHIPSLLMLFCYTKVVYTMWQLSRKLARHSKESLHCSRVNTADLSDTPTPDSYQHEAMPSKVVSMTPDPSSDSGAVSSISQTVDNVKADARRPYAKRKGISRREKKIFLSLTYIVLAYLICWSPFHLIFDVLYFNRNAVTCHWYTFASLMCYLNSAINPILYASANRDFRNTFRRIVSCGLVSRSRGYTV